MGNTCIGLATVAGYCRVRRYEGSPTQAERDAGELMGLNRSATANETFRYFVTNPLKRRLTERSAEHTVRRARNNY